MRADPPTPPSLSTFLVERYWPGVTLAAFTEAAQRIRASVDVLQSSGEPIGELVSTLVPEDEAAYWTVEAQAVRLVELAFSRAEVSYDRILAAIGVDSASVPAGRGVRRDG